MIDEQMLISFAVQYRERNKQLKKKVCLVAIGLTHLDWAHLEKDGRYGLHVASAAGGGTPKLY